MESNNENLSKDEDDLKEKGKQRRGEETKKNLSLVKDDTSQENRGKL